ncbi:probable WRKY transcription factor 50 isoform X1 [Salvia miltiorrhiza]|uniref:probable WRKY transcription factor 50 isoform X1 n=1 Tax=Salvia miltiorrhiza TaxID=226208 RepID=UPI0025AC3BE0|nr:probable WRKY transcription factor 50 isoform X1 [Salvia miltiorrhiza]
MDAQLMIMADDHSYPIKPGSSLGQAHEPGFEVSDFFEFNDWIEEAPSFSSPLSAASYDSQNPSYTPNAGSSWSSSSSSSSFLEGAITMLSGDSGCGREKEKVAFKTKSEVEVLDDGFKWRKYGKKMVKNSPNPRNYYRCSVEGCPVKKRVERDNEDPLYVVTTYEGIHNHKGPHQV